MAFKSEVYLIGGDENDDKRDELSIDYTKLEKKNNRTRQKLHNTVPYFTNHNEGPQSSISHKLSGYIQS